MKQLELQFGGNRTRREKGHYWQDNELVDIWVKRLKLPIECLGMYSYLTRKTNNSTGEVRGSARKFAKEMHESKSKVNRLMNKLRDFGLLKVEFPRDRSDPTIFYIKDVKEMIREQRESESRVPPVGHSDFFSCPTDGTRCPTGGTVLKEEKTKDGKTKSNTPQPPSSGMEPEVRQPGAARSTIATPGDGRSIPLQTDFLKDSARSVGPLGSLPQDIQQNGKVTRKLTSRESKRLKEAVDDLMWNSKGSCRLHPDAGKTPGGNCWSCYSEYSRGEARPQMDRDDAIELACQQLLIPIESAREAFRAAGHMIMHSPEAREFLKQIREKDPNLFGTQ